MKYPMPPIETWDDVDRIVDWCELRKYAVHFRSTHHQAAAPKPVAAMRRACAVLRDLDHVPHVITEYELIFESDDCAIEYRLRFL